MRRTLGLVLAASLIFAACGGGDEADPAADDAAQEQQMDEGVEPEGGSGEPVDVSGESDLEMEVDDFYFEPGTLQGEAGQELTVALHNEGDSPHTFTLSDQDVDEELQPGDETEVTVTFPDSGELEFVCRFHSGQGMTGTLAVAG